MTKNINAINMSLSNYDIDYGSYTDELEQIIKDGDRKIYVLDMDSRKMSGLKVASKIREYDWESIIIVISSCNKNINDIFYTRLMVLDYIYKCNEYDKRLMDDIRMAISIIDKNKVFIFKYNRVIYRIPYNQICYIEKEPDIKRCIIHTINDKYYITGSINWILDQLNECFCRTHQSCIVNLNSISKIDLGSNTIIFKNSDKTNMLTDRMKKEIKKYTGIMK